MPRPHRVEVEGGIHHVVARGIEKRLLFCDAADCRAYLGLLGRVTERMGWFCLAYCLMKNHIHLLIETPSPNLGRGMQKLHGAYATSFNIRHDRAGHLFQGRFGSTLIMTDAQLWAAVAYIARNPVDAGLCARPEAWPWSSHAAVLGEPGPPWLSVSRLLSHTPDEGDALGQYRRLVVPGRLRGAEGSDPSSLVA